MPRHRGSPGAVRGWKSAPGPAGARGGFFWGSPGGMRIAPGALAAGFSRQTSIGRGPKKLNPEGAEGPRYRGAAGGGGSGQSRSGPAKPRRIWGGESRGRRPPPGWGSRNSEPSPGPGGFPWPSPAVPVPQPGGAAVSRGVPAPPGHPGHGVGPNPSSLPGTRYGFVKDWGGWFWGPSLPVPCGDLGSPLAGCPCHQEVPRPAWRGRRRGQGRVLGELTGRRRAPGGRGGTATLPASRGRGGTGSRDRPSMAQYTCTGRLGTGAPVPVHTGQCEGALSSPVWES